MADEVGFKIVITGNSEAAKAALQEVSSEMGKTEEKAKTHAAGGLKSLKQGYLAVAAAVAGAAVVIRDIVKAYMDSEEAQNKLTTAMKNSGTYSKELIDSYNAQAKALQATTAFEDDAVTAAQARLAMYGLEGETLKKVTQGVLDLAAAKGMDLTQASDLVGKSIASTTNQLGRQGVELTGTAGSAERAASAIAGLNERFGGQAAAQLETYAGRLKQLNNYFSDLKELSGKGFLDGVSNAMNLLRDRMSEASGNFGRMIYNLGHAIGSAVSAVVTNVLTIVEIAMTGIKTIMDAAQTIFFAFKEMLGGNLDAAKAEFANFAKDTAKSAKGLWEDIKKNSVSAGKDYVDIWKSLGLQFNEETENTNKKNEDSDQTSQGKRIDYWKAYAEKVKETLEDNQKLFDSIMDATISKLSDGWSGFFESLGKGNKDFLRGFAADTLMAISKMLAKFAVMELLMQNYAVAALAAAAAAGLAFTAGQIRSGGQDVTAMAEGGVVNEPVSGRGMYSGRSYLIGEAGPEAVVPLTKTYNQGMTIQNLTVQANNPADFARQMERASRLMGRHAFA